MATLFYETTVALTHTFVLFLSQVSCVNNNDTKFKFVNQSLIGRLISRRNP